MRDNGVVSLPHPDYLRKLKLSSSISQCSESSHELFLKEIFSSLKEEEKLVTLMLDEIHLTKGLTYKGGKLYGMSVNSEDAATSLQAFMISSLLSKNKHIIALYPVCNISAETLLELTKHVLKFLHTIGFKVAALISDNNRVNRKMFEQICG